ncbi:alpha/beta hydrolase [Altererythrobacter sp. BO-6]|uniref:alpha/beta fold hydrolase n=1 Tax=Altererythrobacter sp. BO-6 TaxID=2604537 RepID=UPI0013E126DA|nr:alpha/beta hydrolase [Altererythrobacter sp. BO-6]QIG55233.1 alpha/beta hydrolase [Altererythrobacter sp. BO-6]
MHANNDTWRRGARYFRFGGHQVAYWTHGLIEADTKPLLLVHGFPTCSWDWAAVWPLLGAERSLIACDMLGFGLSDKPNMQYSIDLQADLQEALLAHLGVTQWDALVHDYGVSVGQELVARQLEGSAARGLEQIVFLNGGIFPDQHRARPIQKLGTSPIGFIVSQFLNRKGFGKSFSQVFGPDTQPSEAELDIFWEFISENGGHRIFHKLLHYIADRRANEARWVGALKQVQPRVGLVNGALDPVSGQHAWQAWRERLPSARQHLLPKVGHYPQVEAPEEVAAKALEWLAEAPRPIRAGSRRAVRGS